MRNWIKPLAHAFVAIMLFVVAALVSRALYVSMAPAPASATSEDADILHEVADCGAQRKESEYGQRALEDTTIRMARCLDS